MKWVVIRESTGSAIHEKALSFFKNPKKTSVLKSFFDKGYSLEVCNFIKRETPHMHFPANFVNL